MNRVHLRAEFGQKSGEVHFVFGRGGIFPVNIEPVEDPRLDHAGTKVARDLHVDAALDESLAIRGCGKDAEQLPLPSDETVNGKVDSTTAVTFAGSFRQLQELKEKYPNIKIVLSIGGGSANPADTQLPICEATSHKI